MSTPSVTRVLDLEDRYRTAAVNAGVPEHLIGGLVRYIVHGIQPGHFLQAVLSNQLSEAFGRADEDSRAGMFQLVCFLHNSAPGICWHSKQRMDDWIGSGGMIARAS